ncbi:creatininase family protein [Methanosarcinales archaeon]|uniref:Creatinine amidohydrolase n=1 Tax=Candidatus Syntropharchaeum caldarium TaxID=1838285 RepID=A0A1F2PBY6_9EURY|nr:MAG: creatinine amidohydrolase [Candidatus Syntrophoarchaeum caldarius]RLG35962.1 MAG: creatininase family protein [Methanosarcinales archaeon]
MQLSEMTWDEVESKLAETKSVILPCGSTEEHGYHLPLVTDALIAEELAKRVADQRTIFVAPAINYGVCRSTAPFAGTLTLRFSTMSALVEDVATALYGHGFRNIIILPGHLGSAQVAAIEVAAQTLLRRFEDLSIAIVILPALLKDIEGVIEDREDKHAGEVETSMMLVLRPEFVRIDKLISEHPDFPMGIVSRNPRDYMKSGVMGDATLASREKGKIIIERLIDGINKIIDQIEQG